MPHLLERAFLFCTRHLCVYLQIERPERVKSDIMPIDYEISNCFTDCQYARRDGAGWNLCGICNVLDKFLLTDCRHREPLNFPHCRLVFYKIQPSFFNMVLHKRIILRVNICKLLPCVNSLYSEQEDTSVAGQNSLFCFFF